MSEDNITISGYYKYKRENGFSCVKEFVPSVRTYARCDKIAPGELSHADNPNPRTAFCILPDGGYIFLTVEGNIIVSGRTYETVTLYRTYQPTISEHTQVYYQGEVVYEGEISYAGYEPGGENLIFVDEPGPTTEDVIRYDPVTSEIITEKPVYEGPSKEAIEYQMTYPQGDMTRELFTKIVDELPKSTVVVPFFRGESLTHPDFAEMMRQLQKFNDVQLATNGDNLTRENQEAIIESCSFMSLSLHAFKYPRQTRSASFFYKLLGNGVKTQVSILDSLVPSQEKQRFVESWRIKGKLVDVS